MNLFVKLDVKAVQDGLIKKVGGVKHFSVLAAIASFANANGEAYPSQDKIAELVGYSRKTVNQYIQELRKVTIDSEPILTIVPETTSNGRRNKYIISQKSGFWFGTGVTKSADKVTPSGNGVVADSGNGVVTNRLQEQEPYNNNHFNNNHIEQENKVIFKNAKEVLQYFRQQYFNKYNVAYQPNWGRDQAMIKNKLLSNFTDSDIKMIIDVAIGEYDNRWANDRFPRPSIGQICSWLGNEALAIAKQRQEEAEKVEADSKKYEMDEDQFERLLNQI